MRSLLEDEVRVMLSSETGKWVEGAAQADGNLDLMSSAMLATGSIIDCASRMGIRVEFIEENYDTLFGGVGGTSDTRPIYECAQSILKGRPGDPPRAGHHRHHHGGKGGAGKPMTSSESSLLKSAMFLVSVLKASSGADERDSVSSAAGSENDDDVDTKAKRSKVGNGGHEEDAFMVQPNKDDLVDEVELVRIHDGAAAFGGGLGADATASTRWSYFAHALNSNPKIERVLQSRRFELLEFLENSHEVTGNPLGDGDAKAEADQEGGGDGDGDGGTVAEAKRINVNGVGAVTISWEDVVQRCVTYVKVQQAEGTFSAESGIRVFELFRTHLLKARHIPADKTNKYSSGATCTSLSVGELSPAQLKKYHRAQSALDAYGVVEIVLETIANDDPDAKMGPLTTCAIELAIELQVGWGWGVPCWPAFLAHTAPLHQPPQLPPAHRHTSTPAHQHTNTPTHQHTNSRLHPTPRSAATR